MRISDWSSDVCSSDLLLAAAFDLERGIALHIGAPQHQHSGIEDAEGSALAIVEQPAIGRAKLGGGRFVGAARKSAARAHRRHLGETPRDIAAERLARMHRAGGAESAGAGQRARLARLK